ncbi:hypothetical protein N7454_006229 [Penicillium verhagenii]|nr:hypothetical protein N7454_006229 [Penicillium verhagenii]
MAWFPGSCDRRKIYGHDLCLAPSKPSVHRGSWAWEWASEALSFLSLALLTSFLLCVNGASYTKWQYPISPNTVVSVIAAAVKASLLVPVASCLGQMKWTKKSNNTAKTLHHLQQLDEASRGPWGSLCLISTTKPSLATIGSILTILAFAIDPFAQQILKFPSRTIPSGDNTAYIPRAQEYNMSGPTGGNPTLPLQLAIVTGLFQNENIETKPLCSSGNCTYPDFVTLGFCSHCENVTSRVNQSCPTPDEFLQSIGVEVSLDCSYEAPNGFHYDSNSTNGSGGITISKSHVWEISRKTSTWNPILVSPWNSTSYIPSSNTNWFEAESMFGIESILLKFFVANYTRPTYWSHGDGLRSEVPPEMTECVLYVCEKEYTQNKVSESQYSFKISRQQQLLIQQWIESGVTYPYVLSPIDGAVPLSDNATYAFDGSLADISLAAASLMNYRSDLTLGPYSNVLSPSLDTRNITQVFDSLATSLTDSIRFVNNEALHVPGTTYEQENYILVHWPWIILPVVTTSLSGILLVMTAVKSRKDGLVLWKGSILPLIMGRMQMKVDNDTSNNPSNLDVAQRLAKSKRFSVKQNDDSILFVEH